MEVQQVRLDSEGVGAEGGTVANVGDRVKAFLAYARSSDVDAVPGNEFFIAAEIDGGHGVFAAIAAPAPGSGQDRKRTSQQVARPAGVPAIQQLSNLAARDALPPQGHPIKNLDRETHFAPELS